MTCQEMGWDSFFQDSLKAYNDPGLAVGRVVGVRKNSFWVWDGEQDHLASVSGRFHFRAGDETGYPVAGDWVIFQRQMITHVLPRKNALVRGASGSRGKRAEQASTAQVMAANLNTVFVVCGLDGDFNPRRIERYLTLIYNCGIAPVVILNKADLHADAAVFEQRVQALSFGAPVHAVAARSGAGLDALHPYLGPGKTGALVGSSGAGKSTLVNRLAGESIQTTRPVGRHMDKGGHTTTSRDLIRLPSKGMLIDNPGIREIAFWGSDGGMASAFPDIEALAAACRFADCRHDREPGCRVRAAVSFGDLAPERLANYRKMLRELDYLSQREDKSAERIEKERWKNISNISRQLKKTKNRY